MKGHQAFATALTLSAACIPAVTARTIQRRSTESLQIVACYFRDGRNHGPPDVTRASWYDDVERSARFEFPQALGNPEKGPWPGQIWMEGHTNRFVFRDGGSVEVTIAPEGSWGSAKSFNWSGQLLHNWQCYGPGLPGQPTYAFDYWDGDLKGSMKCVRTYACEFKW